MKMVKSALNQWPAVILLLFISMTLAACSHVTIHQPANGAAFTQGDNIQFNGELSRSNETGGDNKSDELVWESNIDGQIGSGASFTKNNLSTGSHEIKAYWSHKPARDAKVNIQVNS